MVRRWLGILASLVVVAAALAAALVVAAPAGAQGACAADTEPNDQPSLATLLAGELCLEGALAEGDQDLVAWEVTPAEATTRWSFALTGVEDAITTLQLLRVTSEPGIEPPTLDTTPTIALTSGPDVRDATPREDVLVLPGRYVLAVFRSGSAQGVPDAAIASGVSIERGSPLPPSIDTAPSDDGASGVPLTGAFTGSGDLAASDDHVRWTPDAAGPEARWRLTLQVPVGPAVRITVTTADGLGWTALTASDGLAVVHDLSPDAGGYDVTLSHIDEAPLAWVLTGEAEPTDGPPADPEPNDQAARALPIDPERPLARGRLATAGDSDYWGLTIDEARAATQLDLRLLSPDETSRQVCLSDAADVLLQCRTGAGGAVLSNLFLPPGQYLVRITGEADPDAGYVLRLDATSPPVADYETEPNDTPATATRFDAALVMRGRSIDGDADIYRLTVGGEPQLWQVQAQGRDLSSLDWVDGEGYTLGSGVVADDHASATLHDLYLVPGEHRIRVTGVGGDYSLTATPMGPPDPDAEREPNDDLTRANRIGLGDTRTGRLRARDADWYRFSLAATEHVAVDVDVPDGSATVLVVQTSGQTLGETRGTRVGQDVHYRAILPPGEYALWLYPSQPSEAPYRLDLRREDPFARSGDLEPNDSAATARGVPTSGVIEGTGWGSGDADWYLLPGMSAGRFAIEAEGDVASVELAQGESRIRLVQEEGGTTWSTGEAPAGDALLVVTALGDHVIRKPGAEPSRDPAQPAHALLDDSGYFS